MLNILLLRYLMLSFQVSRILHIIINNLVLSQCFLVGRFFYVDLVPQYLSFKIFYVRFPVYLSKDEHSTHNNGQFVDCPIKIKQILNIFKGFQQIP